MSPLVAGEKFDQLLASFADRPDECWPWPGGTIGGYGRTMIGRRNVLTHVAAYERLVGPVPEELDLDHLCRNRPCMNPRHLEPVTRLVNVMRGVGLAAQWAQRTHCGRGHEFTPENTMERSDGGRRCRICDREKQRRYERARHVAPCP